MLTLLSKMASSFLLLEYIKKPVAFPYRTRLQCRKLHFLFFEQMLKSESGSSAGGVIILITSGSPSVHDVNKLEQVVRESQVQLVPITYPITTRNPQPTPGLESLAHISGKILIFLFALALLRFSLFFTSLHCAILFFFFWYKKYSSI